MGTFHVRSINFNPCGHVPFSGAAGSQGSFNFSFLRNPNAVFHKDCAFPPTVQYALFLYNLTNVYLFNQQIYLFIAIEFLELFIYFGC
jgi:hypothetical protein